MVGEEVAIEVRGLRMRYGSVDVLKRGGFRRAAGEVLVLLGPNGAGKTTTIEILEGFRMRSAGEVRVLGVDPAKGDERWRARLGIVLQSWRDHGKWRVRELLDNLGRYYAPYGTADRKRPWEADDLIGAVGLGGQAGKKISSLSGGQRRRMDVAIGIVGRPELLFLDEPTASSTRTRGASSTTSCIGFRIWKTRRYFSPPTTSTRPRSSPTASSSSRTARS